MTRLQGMAIAVEPAPVPTGAAPAVLREIDGLLGELIAAGTPGRIDLKSLPLSPDDLHWLADALGAGEVRATIETLGSTEIFETAIHGVWRVRHFDEGGNLSADFIEVTQVPEMLKTHSADVPAGRARLRDQLDSLQTSHEGDGHVR